MTSRERILTALAHRGQEKVPVTLAYETPVDIARRYGKESFLPLMRQDIDAFPWPEMAAPHFVSRMGERVAALHEQGHAVQCAMSQTIFELAWNMMGMERLLVETAAKRKRVSGSGCGIDTIAAQASAPLLRGAAA